MSIISVVSEPSHTRQSAVANRKYDQFATDISDGSGERVASNRARLRLWFSSRFTAVLDELGPQEVRRRMLHMAPGLTPFLLWPFPLEFYRFYSYILPAGTLSFANSLFPHDNQLALIRGLVILTTVVVFAILGVRNYSRIARPGDCHVVGSVLGYAAVVLSTFILFPAHAEFGFIVVAAIALGDGSATLAGLLWGRRKLPWNQHKSWAGMCCFVLGATPFATLFYWKEAGTVPFQIALITALASMIVAAIVETIPSRINDNIRVGVAAAVMVVIIHGILP